MPSVRDNNATTKNAGFTLVELVIVIIVLGILAATAIPKLASKSGFEDYTVRDQLIARLRLVQLQGMNADPTVGATENGCYWLVVTEGCFYHELTGKTAGVCVAPSASDRCASDQYDQYNSVSFSSNMLTPNVYRFDLQGRLTFNNNQITAPYFINLAGDNNLKIKIETEGYIHAQ